VSELEPASFDVERFEVRPDSCVEVSGRWSGVKGRRFMRPALTAITGGREYRLLALLDHKPWVAEEGEPWCAAFPWSTEQGGLREAELTVAPDVTVRLPPPSLPTGGRRRRSSPTPARGRRAAAGSAPAARSKDDEADNGGRLREEHDAAVRSRDAAVVELGEVKRHRDELRRELKAALAAQQTAAAERHDAIEAEVELRIADLRAEAERERASAMKAAEFGRERDAARAERTEALRERDKAVAERDAARLERSRMLAQREKARSRAEDALGRWESTAALGTRRTEERDAAVIGRDRAVRERDAAIEHGGRLERERDALVAQLEQAREQLAARRDGASTDSGGEAGRILETVEIRSLPAEPDQKERPTTRMPAARPPVRRPRRPPAPARSAPAVRVDTSSPGAALRGTVTPEIWRARLLAVAALLVALVLSIVILTAK
jgi:hypothetical protein